MDKIGQPRKTPSLLYSESSGTLAECLLLECLPSPPSPLEKSRLILPADEQALGKLMGGRYKKRNGPPTTV